MKLTYTDCKDIIRDYGRETLEDFISDAFDYSSTYRIISEEEALKEVINMYEGDLYILGCFNANFIEEFIPLDYEDIKTIQEGEQYEVIGKLIINSGNLEAMMEEYIRLDGYGHALNSYDGNHEELYIDGNTYIVYRQN